MCAVGDFVTPIKTTKTNEHCWTIGKKYKVLRVQKRFSYDDKTKEFVNFRRLVVINDLGKSNKIKISCRFVWRQHGNFEFNATDKWKCV
jgi:uncharacterized protein YxjI